MHHRHIETELPDSFKKLLGDDAPHTEVRRMADAVMERIELERKDKKRL